MREKCSDRVLKALKRTEDEAKTNLPRMMSMDEFTGIAGMTITVREAQEKYGLSAYKINKIAKERDAVLYIGDREYILEARLEEYIREKEMKNELGRKYEQ